MIIDELEKIKENILKELADVKDIKSINEIKVKVFGKNGVITNLSKGMRDISPEERPKIGALINEARVFLT